MDNRELTFNQLGFKYDKSEVLSIEKMVLQTGITTVFLGSNGSGKTTVLKLLSGLLEPDRGSVSSPSGTLRDRAVMVHQVPYLFTGSVKYNIKFALKSYKTEPAKQETVTETVLKQAELLHLINRKSSSLSGGEKHRLAIVRAVAVNPEILVLDEPFAHIDTNSRILIEKIIESRSETGKTTIISTHNIASAFRLADKIVHLEGGKVKDPDYNFFRGSVEKRDDHFSGFITKEKNISILAIGYDKDYRTAVIHYSDIFLSMKKIKTSAQNQLKGKISAMREKEGRFCITINCGIELNAFISELSVLEFKLETGVEVFVNFKASAVRLY